MLCFQSSSGWCASLSIQENKATEWTLEPGKSSHTLSPSTLVPWVERRKSHRPHKSAQKPDLASGSPPLLTLITFILVVLQAESKDFVGKEEVTVQVHCAPFHLSCCASRATRVHSGWRSWGASQVPTAQAQRLTAHPLSVGVWLPVSQCGMSSRWQRWLG